MTESTETLSINVFIDILCKLGETFRCPVTVQDIAIVCNPINKDRFTNCPNNKLPLSFISYIAYEKSFYEALSNSKFIHITKPTGLNIQILSERSEEFCDKSTENIKCRLQATYKEIIRQLNLTGTISPGDIIFTITIHKDTTNTYKINGWFDKLERVSVLFDISADTFRHYIDHIERGVHEINNWLQGDPATFTPSTPSTHVNPASVTTLSIYHPPEEFDTHTDSITKPGESGDLFESLGINVDDGDRGIDRDRDSVLSPSEDASATVDPANLIHRFHMASKEPHIHHKPDTSSDSGGWCVIS